MIITSKYFGKCLSCGESYEPGDHIWWAAGEDTVCALCHDSDVANESSPVKPVQKGVTVRYNPPVKKTATIEELEQRVSKLEKWYEACQERIIEAEE